MCILVLWRLDLTFYCGYVWARQSVGKITDVIEQPHRNIRSMIKDTMRTWQNVQDMKIAINHIIQTKVKTGWFLSWDRTTKWLMLRYFTVSPGSRNRSRESGYVMDSHVIHRLSSLRLRCFSEFFINIALLCGVLVLCGMLGRWYFKMH